MADRNFLDWPFFDLHHRDWAARPEAWAAAHLTGIEHGDTDASCRDLVARPSRDGGAVRNRSGQAVIDKAVQIHGSDGKGHVVERLCHEIRALRIYKGASDAQKVIIARQTLANLAADTATGG
jgi:hypothetical protein